MNEGKHIMVKANWMASLAIGTLVSAAAFADETAASAAEAQASPAVKLRSDSLLAKLERTSRWQLLPPAAAARYSDDWPAPIADFDFREASTLARVSKLRSLSLLTLAEFGQTRMFLGINDSGLLGLHWSGLPRHADGRYLELIRMPYLRESGPAGQGERPATLPR